MTIKQLCSKTLTPAIAYAVGMVLPLYKEKTLNETTYIIGSVNHNHNPENVALEIPNTSLTYISEAEIAEHFNKIYNFFANNQLDVRILANSNYLGTISAKKGFSILFEKEENTTQECKNMLNNILDKIKEEDSLEIKRCFIKGCFDGRSSIDWNNKKKIIRYFSLDVDRIYSIQDKISEIAQSIGISVNLNRREEEHSKNDQIRIKPETFSKFKENIGFFSPLRDRQLTYSIKH